MLGIKEPFPSWHVLWQVLLNPCQPFLTQGSAWTSGSVPSSQWRCSVATWAKGGSSLQSQQPGLLSGQWNQLKLWVSRVFFSKELTKQLQNPELFVSWSRGDGERGDIYMQPVEEINFLTANRFVNGSFLFCMFAVFCKWSSGLYSTNKIFWLLKFL